MVTECVIRLVSGFEIGKTHRERERERVMYGEREREKKRGTGKTEDRNTNTQGGFILYKFVCAGTQSFYEVIKETDQVISLNTLLTHRSC